MGKIPKQEVESVKLSIRKLGAWRFVVTGTRSGVPGVSNILFFDCNPGNTSDDIEL